MTTPNETGKTAPSKTITRKHTYQMGTLQATVACVANVGFAK